MPTSDSLRARLSPPRQTVGHGPWSVELATDEFVELRWRDRVVLRGIRAAIRDQDWRTLPATATAVHDDETPDGRTVRLDIDYAGWGQTYSATVSLQLSADAARIEFDGRADVPFRGNRIGLVVLHEPSDAGDSVTITSPDGAESASEFPVEIQPHQPFTNIAGMHWRHDDVSVDLRFAGDTFETEDQRNWTDASFKTYSTPLDLPYPVDHPAGSTVHQSVTVTIEPDAARAERGRDQPVPREVVISDEVIGRVPAIGISASTDPAARAPLAAIDGLDALLVELTGPIQTRGTRLADARHEAALLHVPLDLRIVAEDPTELAATLDLADLADVARIGVFDPRSHVTEPELWAALKAEAAGRAFAGSLVAGTRAHFTELNRTIERLPPDAGAIVFSIAPQMHAEEVERIVQTLPMHRIVAENALRLGGGRQLHSRPLHIGPIALKPRFNAVATRGGYDEATRVAMITDELQSSTFTAAWTLGSIAALSGVAHTVGGAGGGSIASVSYFETSGARGIDAADGAPHPVGRLIRALAPLRGNDVLRAVGVDDTLVVYPVRVASGVIVFVANLGAEARSVSIRLGDDVHEVALEPWATHTLEVSHQSFRTTEGRTS